MRLRWERAVSGVPIVPTRPRLIRCIPSLPVLSMPRSPDSALFITDGPKARAPGMTAATRLRAMGSYLSRVSIRHSAVVAATPPSRRSTTPSRAPRGGRAAGGRLAPHRGHRRRFSPTSRSSSEGPVVVVHSTTCSRTGVDQPHRFRSIRCRCPHRCLRLPRGSRYSDEGHAPRNRQGGPQGTEARRGVRVQPRCGAE